MSYSIETDNGHVFLTDTHIVDALDWILDCEDLDWILDVDDLTDREIVHGIARHFDGGWSAFLASY